MVNLTLNEKKALLIIFKEFDNYYNANSLSKKIGLSRVGMTKILRKLEKASVLKSKQVGKSVIYKINFSNDYVVDLMTFLLSDEASDYQRWKDEFRDLFEYGKFLLIYGSATINYSKASDIDLMIIDGKNSMSKIIREKQKVLSKKIHLIELSEKDFLSNLEKKQKSFIEIVKSAVVLSGQNKYVELMKNVESI